MNEVYVGNAIMISRIDLCASKMVSEHPLAKED